MTFKIMDVKCVLITGGGGGIGLALAEYFLQQGKKVIICGRTERKLQDASKKLQGCPYYVLDTGNIKAIPEFVHTVTKNHPELDALVNNAGVQRPLSVQNMSNEEFMEKADNEININIRGPMHLALTLLSHFKQKPGAVIVNVSSVLGYIPISVINPAWLHFWSMNLRTQLEQAGTNVRVVEIAPPTVGTDLHRERENPDDNKKNANAASLSVEEFMEEVAAQLQEDKDVISAGPARGIVGRWYKEFGPDYEKAASGGKK